GAAAGAPRRQGGGRPAHRGAAPAHDARSRRRSPPAKGEASSERAQGDAPPARRGRPLTPRTAHPKRKRSAVSVALSAGKNDSMASSATVMSSAVPKVASVLENDSSTPSLVRSTKGTKSREAVSTAIDDASTPG